VQSFKAISWWALKSCTIKCYMSMKINYSSITYFLFVCNWTVYESNWIFLIVMTFYFQLLVCWLGRTMYCSRKGNSYESCIFWCFFCVCNNFTNASLESYQLLKHIYTDNISSIHMLWNCRKQFQMY